MKRRKAGMFLLVLVSVMTITFILVGVKEGSSTRDTENDMILEIKIHQIQKNR